MRISANASAIILSKIPRSQRRVRSEIYKNCGNGGIPESTNSRLVKTQAYQIFRGPDTSW